MTDQEIYNLLIKIDRGYVPTLQQKQELSSVNEIYWGSINKLPKCIGLLSALSYLDLSGTQVSDIRALSNLTSLTSLFLSMTKVSDIRALSNLTSLTDLNLLGTQVSDIRALSNLTSLTSLFLSMTKVSDIRALSNLTSLTTLDLSVTKVSDIRALSGLTSLTNLDLSYTEVNDISAISGLTSLKRIGLRGLTLFSLPESFLDLNIGYVIDKSRYAREGILLSGVTLTEQPIEIFSQGREVIREWYKTQRENQETRPVNECKVVFLGDGGAGKTLIIDRLMHDGEKSSNFDGESTPGICISSKKYLIEKDNIELHFWDFGGQAIMHSMHRLFLTNRTLYVVVANARDNKANEQAWYWIRNIKSFADGSPILLLVNQKDQNPSVNVNFNGMKKDCSELMDVRIISAFKDSAEEFNSEVRDTICRIVGGMATVHTPFVKSWLSLMNHLQKMPEDYITSDAFLEKCREKGVGEDEKLLDEIISWYQDLGVCFYSRKHPAARQYMVLKPRWLLNALYVLAFNGRSYANNGIIREEDIYPKINAKVELHFIGAHD